MNKKIRIQGARENNLKNIDLEIPRDKLVVFTGLSGSGKSSLAFDTIYAEGQRRYVESLSSYARQFLGQCAKPDVDFIEGLSPAIAIDQKTTNRNPRSTVGTVTEIYDYMRILFARAGIAHCPKCGKEIQKQSVDQITDKIMTLGNGTRLQILAPIVKQRKGEHAKLLENAAKSGYARVIIDSIAYDLSDKIELDKNKKHDIDIVVDRIVLKDGIQKRLTESVETACSLSGGVVKADIPNEESYLFSQSFSCPDCDISIDEIEPRLFSFNNPSGACPECTGLGMKMIFDEDLIIDKEKSINDDFCSVMGISANSSFSLTLYKAVAEKYNFSLDTPFKDLDKKIQKALLYGTGNDTYQYKYISNGIEKYYSHKFEGIIPTLEKRFNDTSSDYARSEYEQYMLNIDCPACKGQRLKPEVLAITFGGKNISQICEMTIKDIYNFFENADISEKQRKISELIVNEIKARLKFLIDVGLDYLCLSRRAGTLSGGEAQRIRLATQIGSGLTGVLYVLDEPSIGLHQRDNDKLLSTLKNLRDLGNTLIVVEHDSDTILAADYVVDIGVGAGSHGGNVIFSGTPKKLLECKDSITADYLSKRKQIEVPSQRRQIDPSKMLIIRKAAENNLKNIDVSIPLGMLVCVTGVSGSGKSSLVNEILYKTLARDLNRAKTRPGKCSGIEGIENLDKVIDIDQAPIGKTPRSNPATYTGLFDLIRDLYTQMPEAKARGYKKGRFSFNTKGGRCEACCGDGIIKIEMHFLPDVYVPCEVCGGKRYNRETLEVKYKGKSIADVLDMTVEEALEFFSGIPKIKDKIQTLYDVGLSYVKLGQSSTTLSGGESQRVKLAEQLSRKSTGKTIYILDEPTTGLHTADVHSLVKILQSLVNSGNSVVVIEHNLDVIKTADYIIDLGKEGGDKGGNIVAQGTPEEIAKSRKSYTGKYLRDYVD